MGYTRPRPMVRREKVMIHEAPHYQIACNCGIVISGNSENGIVSLLKKHLESGRFHTAWLLENNIKPSEIDLQKIVDSVSSMKTKVGIV